MVLFGLDQRVIYLNLIFFFLRTTILYYNSSNYPIQLIQYYQMSGSSKIDSFNITNIIFYNSQIQIKIKYSSTRFIIIV